MCCAAFIFIFIFDTDFYANKKNAFNTIEQ